MQKILIIDDEDFFRSRVQSVLRAKGYDTTVASNGAQGIGLIRLGPPDLIICDLNMDEGDGYTVLDAVRNDIVTASVPFILMTGDEAQGIRRGMERGADDYLCKPFSPADLLAAVQAQLKKQQAQRQHAERTRARLVAILEATPDFVGIADLKNRNVSYLNRAGRGMIGITDTEDISQLIIQDCHPAWAREIIERDGIPTALLAGVWAGETALITRQGEEVPISQLILAHKATDGSVEYLSTIARDISERKKLEKERSLMELKLRQALKLESIGQLAAGIAHEINTPTQYIGDNARFLQDSFAQLSTVLRHYESLLTAVKENAVTPGLVSEVETATLAADLSYLFEEIPKAIEQTLHGVQRVSKIVGAMKDFSHPGSDEKTPVDINKAIDSTITVARNEWKYVAEMRTDFDGALPAVPCLPGEFNQVILNVIVNAAHAIADTVGDGGKGKGVITVSTQRIGQWAEIRLQDTGSGIPEHIRNRIFEPFFTTKCVGKGTGQGLAIAHSVIVDKHGGTMTFESELGRGTTFVIRLPINPGVATSLRRVA